ncbi:rfaE bifunctional protein nucleotidyltransferase chain/domain/rfaE bifunctional protein kinase chain/domain [Paenarthrobacter nitroguajacolicus]|uniref:D-glycero-beta-D-manno-heptose 1-phosphate adenylyltransferase n=1 Tax=Paenarthrobacter nitroguajacolicus TaxID=211146 RepID=UPI00285CEF82|nr:D-glycero-beta-D-manno-heptose 1-phosphate adenylyltransferase [Paenarthrobacter nitroguajacolicus]MDR6988695.1 rfaE bifunctional protein nucleotidyltransferase chain/domain/rfaE bifunctional protein kinase chain/domain [Paenarthrobacter nitroguajacolicus]
MARLPNHEGLANQEGLADWVPGRLAEERPVVTVIGDSILDGWWEGTIERFCREAPAPVVQVQRRDFAPGGAANTAMNLAAMGAEVRFVSLIGEDPAGRTLLGQLRSTGVDVSHVVAHSAMTTTTKYRVSSGGQVMLRLDDAATEIPDAGLEEMAAAVPEAIRGSAAVVLCDYAAGALEGPVRNSILRHLGPRGDTTDSPDSGPSRQDTLVVVDAHHPGRWAELRPDLATPNAQEAARLLGTEFPGGAARCPFVEAHGDQLLSASGAGAVVVTLDREGTLTIRRKAPQDVATHRTWARPEAEKQASGAGDTFVAALTLARSAGLPLTTSVDLAQAAADVVVHRPGTSVCTTEELAKHLRGFADTALTATELAQHVDEHRRAGRRIVLTNGCFDVLHRGHTRYLNQAKQLGDVLVVALNSDSSVRQLKGPERPVNHEADRAAVIAALSCVDHVTVFDTPTPIPLIELLRPDVYAKGGDYTPEMLQETEAVERCGGTVTILDYVPEHSTTAVLERIRSTGETPKS